MLAYYFDSFSQLFESNADAQRIVFKVLLGLRSCGMLVQTLTFIQNFKLKVRFYHQFLERFFAEGDKKVKRATSVKVGISILFLYVLLASPMVYFKIKFVQFLISMLALFSLTTSYLLPTLYKIKLDKPVKVERTSLMREDDEDNVDLDFGKPEQTAELGRKANVMQNYFKQYQKEGQKRNKIKSDQSTCAKTTLLILNFSLIGVIVCCYCLIVFNFAYHTVKPYVD